MILYLDTSALVKLYVREADSDKVSALAKRAEALATSVVAYAEARAAFARLRQEGLATEENHHRRLSRFNADWESFLRVELVPAVVRSSGELAETHALRGFDAIHLASAVWLADRSPAPVHFAVFDRRLLLAADRAGLVTAP